MAARRTQSGPATSYATVIAGASLLAAGVATAFGVPGAPIVWVALMVAGWLEQTPMFTGKKDQRGYPTPAHPGEQKAMNTYRFWRDLRWRLVCPTMDWLPGWPILGSWLAALAAGVLVSFAPIRPDLPAGLVWANVGAAVVTVAQVFASLRRTVAEDDQCPGTRLDTLPTLLQDKKAAVMLGVAVVAVAAVGAFVAGRFVPQVVTVTGPVGSLSPYFFPALVAVAAGGGVLAHPWQTMALATWRELVLVRRQWAPRWQMLKHDPAPFLSGHRMVGPATVDTFDAPASVGAASFYQQSKSIIPTLGTNMRVAVLEVPNTDGQGQPVLGTCHPLRFEVVMWPTDQTPDITTPGTDPAVAEMLIRCAMSWAADTIGFARFVLTGADLITAPESAAVWATQWASTSELGLSYIRRNAASVIAGGAGAVVLTDHRAMSGAGLMFVGAVGDPDVDFTDGSGVTAQALAEIAEEDEWGARWAVVLKQNVNAPVPQFPVKAQADLADGTTIFYQPFVTLSGEDPAQFMTGLEGKLKATIPGSAPFLSIAWYSQRGTDRSGERHAQAFTVAWSNRPVPSLTRLSTTRGDAPRWVISGLMNEAFTAARLTRPEVLSVQALTTPTSREHIWQVTLRLYGGVTLSDVRGAATRIKVALGTPWLRVATHAEGCIIFAGGPPAKVKLARPERDTPRLVALDWEQAWLDSKVSGVAGLLPSLTEVGHLPKNDQVQVLDFDLPAGIAIGDIKEATDKLRTATANAFIDVREGVNGAASVRLLTCEVSPMPTFAPFDFPYIDGSSAIPFATGVEGDAIVYDFLNDPHLLIVGGTGSGKSATLQTLIYSAIVLGCDVYVADPTKGGADFQFAMPWVTSFTTDVYDAAAMMNGVYAEVVRRKNLNASYGVGSYLELPDDVRPPHAIVILDEFTSLMMTDALQKPDLEDEDAVREYESLQALNAAKHSIGSRSGRVAREARSAGMTLWLATQRLTAKTLEQIPGAQDLRDLALDTRLPVPASDRFPSGWAQNRDLQVGDLIFTPDGGVAPVLGFSAVFDDNDLFEVEFDDGQVVRAGAEHLWLASSEESRTQHSRARTQVGPARLRRADVAERLASLTAAGTWARPEQIADLLGYDVGSVKRLALDFGLEQMMVDEAGDVATYRWAARRGSAPELWQVDEVAAALAGTSRFGAVEALAPLAGKWATARVTAEALSGEPTTKSRAGALGTFLKAAGVPSKASERAEAGHLLYEVTEFCARLAVELRRASGVDVLTGEAAPLERVVTTAEMGDTVASPRGRRNWAVRLAAPVDCADVDLPVDPYVLGAWLGDGHAAQAIITSGFSAACTGPDGVTDQERMIWNLSAAGYDGHRLQCSPYLVGTRGLLVRLREAGVLRNKHIPAAYLRASFGQRLALLQGLMDTDGTCAKSGEARFDQVRPGLTDDVFELIQSLGIKVHRTSRPSMFTNRATGVSEPTGQTTHHLTFRTDLPVFRLPRKLARQSVRTEGGAATWRYVREVRRVASVPTRCIAVDHPEHLFLVEGFVPTHNSNMSRLILGKATLGELQSALKDPYSAPPMGDSVPRGRGLLEVSGERIQLVQSWYVQDIQAVLAANLRERRPALEESARLDLTPYMPRRPASEQPDPRFDRPSAEPVVVELDDLELSLDDLDLDDDGPAPDGELPAWAAEFAAAQAHGKDAVADPFVAEPRTVDLLVEHLPITPTRPAWADVAQPDRHNEDDEMLETFTAPPPRIPAGVAMFGVAMGDAAVALTPAGDEFGWWKIDATVAWLDAHPEVARVVFADDELDELDDLEIPFRDVLADVLESRGVAHLLLSPAGNALTDDDIGAIDDFLDAGETSDDEAILTDTFRPATSPEDDAAAFEVKVAETVEATAPEPVATRAAPPVPFVPVRRAALRDLSAPMTVPVPEPVVIPAPAARRRMTAAIPDEW